MAVYLTALERNDFTTVVRVLDKYVEGGLRRRAYPVMFAVIAQMGETVTRPSVGSQRSRENEAVEALKVDADTLEQFMALLTRTQEGG